MSTRRIHTTATTGWTVYAVVIRLSDGKAFDWDDSTWQVLGSAVEPELALASVVSGGGSESLFAADLNLSTINATDTPVAVLVKSYRQLGGSAAPSTDTPLGETDSFEIASGEVVSGEATAVVAALNAEMFCDVAVNYTSLTGTSLHLKASLVRRDGTQVDLTTLDPAATCTAVITLDADETAGDRFPVIDLDSTEVGAFNTDNYFEVELENPGLTALKGYVGTMTITYLSDDYVGTVKFAG